MQRPPTVSRRNFLKCSGTLAVAAPWLTAPCWAAAVDEDRVAAAVELAHTEIWRRFIDEHDVMLDYTDLEGRYQRATPEECRAGKPNALAWWTPVENGAMFNGLYLDAAVNRALATGLEEDRAKARRLVEGLLRLASIGEVKGFVARCLATDGKTTYPMGSNDQTGPWFYGLWRYLNSGLADTALRERVVAKMVEVADVLESTEWRMPAAAPFDFRGSFAGYTWDAGARLLFLHQAMHRLTGDAKWRKHYEQSLNESRGRQPTRLEACRRGLEGRETPAAWTGSVSVACLRELWEWETDPSVRSAFAQGLAASADFVADKLSLRHEFDNEGQSNFEWDWRKMNAMWRPQKTPTEANELAREQLNWLNKQSPRRREEMKLVREATFTAWIVSLCPDGEIVARHRGEVLETLAYFQYDRLHYSQFFPVESAWYRLRTAAGKA